MIHDDPFSEAGLADCQYACLETPAKAYSGALSGTAAYVGSPTVRGITGNCPPVKRSLSLAAPISCHFADAFWIPSCTTDASRTATHGGLDFV